MGNVFKRRVAAILLICLAVLAPVQTVQAAKDSKDSKASEAISKVSVRISSKLEAGSTLPTIELDTGTPENGGR